MVTEAKVDFIRNDFKRIFMPHLNGIGKLLRRQLTGARENGHEVTVYALFSPQHSIMTKFKTRKFF